MKLPRNLAEAVYATVCWFAVFDHSPTLVEIHRYLFFRRATLSEVRAALERDPRLEQSCGCYFLRGQNHLVLRRCQHHYQATDLWKKVFAKKYFWHWIPFLRLAAVGNTLAMGWPERDSDIDLLIVAKQDRLFTTRAVVTLLTQLFGVRRHGKKITGRFCLSFFLSDNALGLQDLKIGKHDPYLAFWLATLTPIWGGALEDLLAANSWVKIYFPNLEQKYKKIRYAKNTLEKLLSGRLGDWLEKSLAHYQLRRAKAKKRSSYAEKTSVIITPSILKFHEQDRRREYLAAWGKKLKRK